MLHSAPMPDLSDNQAHDLLIAAREALGDQRGETVRADTALAAARRALDMLALGLLVASERGLDDVPGVRKPANGS